VKEAVRNSGIGFPWAGFMPLECISTICGLPSRGKKQQPIRSLESNHRESGSCAMKWQDLTIPFGVPACLRAASQDGSGHESQVWLSLAAPISAPRTHEGYMRIMGRKRQSHIRADLLLDLGVIGSRTNSAVVSATALTFGACRIPPWSGG
jgi:hypothetical protein